MKVDLNCLDPGKVHLNNLNAPILSVLGTHCFRGFNIIFQCPEWPSKFLFSTTFPTEVLCTVCVFPIHTVSNFMQVILHLSSCCSYHQYIINLFLQIIPYDGIRTIPKRPSEGQARAKFNFFAQTHLELSLVKGEAQ